MIRNATIVLHALLSTVFFACSASEPADVYAVSPLLDIETNKGQTLDLKLNPEKEIIKQSQGDFKALGVGGGGALSAYSINPYNNDLRFVGTDMGTLFRSSDKGNSWQAVSHFEAVFHHDLSKSVELGFSSDGKTIFHAPGGRQASRSIDQGVTFEAINIPLHKDEFIRYWHADTYDADLVYVVTNKGFLRSEDNGLSWLRNGQLKEEGLGTFSLFRNKQRYVFHATSNKVYVSFDSGKTFKSYYQPLGHRIRKFTGGHDANGVTLAYISDQGRMAVDASGVKGVYEKGSGLVYVQKNLGDFMLTKQFAGDHIRMAENNSQRIYVTGSRFWGRGQGTRVYKSENAGLDWALMLHQLDWDQKPYNPWPQDKLDYSAVALDVGWFDSGYRSFAVSKLDSSIVGGTGNFFLHTSEDGGGKWQAPFTEFKGLGKPAKNQTWLTNGIEVNTVYKVEANPQNNKKLFVAMADIGGLVSQDGGESFRILKLGHNSNFDYAFDASNEDVIYAATGDRHDWPHWKHGRVLKGTGGIYRSVDGGNKWERLTPKDANFNRQYLSVAYDSKRKILYAGTQGAGIIVSKDLGKTWQFFNFGLSTTDKIIPQIEIDAETGNVYILLAGNGPVFSNHESTGIYKLDSNAAVKRWEILRSYVSQPDAWKEGRSIKWLFPVRFAIDFKRPNTLWLIDYEKKGQWMMTGVWKSENEGNSWKMVQQFTHPTDIKINPHDPNHIVVSGLYKLNGKWGQGGILHSYDNGETWHKDMRPSLQSNAYAVSFDAVNKDKIYYGFFGGGILYGDLPNKGK